MANLEMQGPYVLIPDKIDEIVTAKTPGNYALGYIADKNFIVVYIGRSDNDLNSELKKLVFCKSDCLFFKFFLVKSADEAFEKECLNYHDFGGNTGLKNNKHPVPLKGFDWKCPVCERAGG